MGAKSQNTVNYFPHFISDGKKMFFIEKKYGNDGYATWFKILEKIATTENHFLNLNDDQEIMYLSAKCNIDETTLINIITDLAKLGAIDAYLWASRVVWSQRFIDEIQTAYKRRNNNCIQYYDLCIQLKYNGILSVDNYPQSRVDKSRVDKSISTNVDIPVGQPAAAPTSVTPVAYAERCRLFVVKFNEIRGTKFQVTANVIKKLKPRLEKYRPEQILAALKNAIEDPYHVENNFKYLTPEFILREDKIEYFLNLTLVPEKNEPQPGTQFISHQNRPNI